MTPNESDHASLALPLGVEAPSWPDSGLEAAAGDIRSIASTIDDLGPPNPRRKAMIDSSIAKAAAESQPPSALTLFVKGNPVAQGSLKSFGRGRLVNDNPELERWRGQVYAAARDAWDFAEPLDGPLRVTVFFYVMSAGRRRRYRAEKVATVDTLVKPYWLATVGAHDIDKLARAVLDALTLAKVWRDDGLVCDLHALAFFAAPPDIPPGARIYVEAIL